MIVDRLTAAPWELVRALLSQPLTSVVLALLIGAAVLVLRRRPAPEGSATPERADAASVISRYAPEARALRIAGIAVIATVVVENLVALFLWASSDAVSWWRYAAQMLAALVGVAVVLALVVFRRATTPRQPVPSVERRTWTTFAKRRDLILAASAAGILLATILAAGAASSPDPQGRYVWLEIGIPNTSVDPLRPWFFGWAYGIPVLLSLIALLAISVGALLANAARPFLAPDTVRAERRLRSGVASSILGITTAATMLSLAASWRFIARSGGTSGLTIEADGHTESYEVTWRFAELAIAAGWVAPVVEITAILLLLVTIARARVVHPSRASQPSTADMVDAEGPR